MSEPSTRNSKIVSCYTTWHDNYYDTWSRVDGVGLAPHLRALLKLVAEIESGSVLDVGCGPASFLRELNSDHIAIYGSDLTPAMIEEAQRVMAARGVPADRFWVGDVLTPPIARGPEGQGLDQYDAVICAGVLAHIQPEDDRAALTALQDAVAPGGTLAVQGRNQFFSLFTGNRYTRDFVLGDLANFDGLMETAQSAGDEAESDALLSVRDEWNALFRTDQPPLRETENGVGGYDEIYNRFHNPVEMLDQMRSMGLENCRLRYCNYHALPPMFADQVPNLSAAAAATLEDQNDWRGLFMASSFFAVGTKPAQ